MKLLSDTPPWKLALGGLLLVILIFVGTAQAQSAVQALTQRLPAAEILGVLQWVLGICLAAIFAVGYTVYVGVVNKLHQIERDQRLERTLRQRTSAATLSVLLMLYPEAFEQINEKWRKVMKNGSEHDQD